jgi:hypothetical protein
MWHKELWLIDHGAALYFQHAWDRWREQSESRFPQINEHILLPFATDLAAADEHMRSVLTPEVFREVCEIIPDEFLGDQADEKRSIYVGFLTARLAASDTFPEEAENARKALV